jgi:hypothetical protein
MSYSPQTGYLYVTAADRPAGRIAPGASTAVSVPEYFAPSAGGRILPLRPIR